MAYYWNKDGNVMDREIRRNETVTFFANVRNLAKENGLTNRELASVLDINTAMLWKYCNGTTVPREESFEALKKRAMDFFDISGSELVDKDFKEVRNEVVVAEPVKEEEDGPKSEVLNYEMRLAIQQRRDRIAQLQKEIDALELALTIMKEDHIL